MIIHCEINCKPKSKDKSMKVFKVEYIHNNGYWAKWYVAYSESHAKQLFEAEFPDRQYCRSKLH